MEMSASSLPEEDLSCPVCCDIFSDPVLLPCSHSFCRSCLHSFWESSSSRSCPVCRRKTSKRPPPSNLALRNLCEAFLRMQKNTAICPEHGERLKLFCSEDQQPICVVCQASRRHQGHRCTPTDEAALDCKNRLRASLTTLMDKLDHVNQLRSTAALTLEHIKSQSHHTEERIREQFQQLYRFLQEEEENRVSDLKEEEKRKLLVIKEREELLLHRATSLIETIQCTKRNLAADDLTTLQNFRSIMERSQAQPQTPDCLQDSLINQAQHLRNLKFSVWEKMQVIAPYFPVTLDPNTVHPCLHLSGDLTCLHYSSSCPPLPCNPERFCISAEVLGSHALASGAHSWEVEVGSSEDWIVGVASTSIKRNAEVPARPENGFWTLCMRDGIYRAMMSPPVILNVEGKLQRLRVQVDWDMGEVRFIHPENERLLHIFNHTFRDKVVPYFYTQSERPLSILPAPVLITVKQNCS